MTLRSHTFLAVLLAAAAAAACGGKQSRHTVPDETGDSDLPPSSESDSEPSDSGSVGGVIVPPDTMDEIQRRFERKRTPVSRCLSTAVDAKELPRNARGKITLNVVVMPGGRAGEIKIVRTTLESPLLAECVIGKVRDIIFPEVPKPFPTSYTYGFEAM
jgi:hypothetical protein